MGGFVHHELINNHSRLVCRSLTLPPPAQSLGVTASQVEITGYAAGSLVVETKVAGLESASHAKDMAARVRTRTNAGALLSSDYGPCAVTSINVLTERASPVAVKPVAKLKPKPNPPPSAASGPEAAPVGASSTSRSAPSRSVSLPPGGGRRLNERTDSFKDKGKGKRRLSTVARAVMAGGMWGRKRQETGAGTASAADDAAAKAGSAARREIEDLYRMYNPAKLEELDSLVAALGEDELLSMVREKYLGGGGGGGLGGSRQRPRPSPRGPGKGGAKGATTASPPGPALLSPTTSDDEGGGQRRVKSSEGGGGVVSTDASSPAPGVV